LKRTELVALFNTYARLSSSLSAIQKFRAMVETDAAKKVDEALEAAEKINVIPDRVKKPRHAVPGSSEAVDEEHEEHRPPPKYQNHSVKDDFDSELEQVMKALKYIFKSWISFPVVLYVPPPLAENFDFRRLLTSSLVGIS
jgi:hypothetical protein